MLIHIIGSPNIGKYRELKFFTEKFFNKNSSNNLLNLLMEIKKIKFENFFLQINKNFDILTFGDFTLYDNVLDLSCLTNSLKNDNIININKYFSFARGDGMLSPCIMKKFFNTNYHYFVPCCFNNLKILNNSFFLDILELKKIGILPKIILFGAISFLFLSENYNKYIKNFFEIYIYILFKIKKNFNYFQFEEPILSCKINNDWKFKFNYFYNKISKIKIKILITNLYGELFEFDFLNIKKNIILSINYSNNLNLKNKVSVGVIDCSVNKTNLLCFIKKNIELGTINLFNKIIPYDTSIEKNLKIKKYLSFFYQKINELKLLKNIKLKKINFLDILYLNNFKIYKEKISLNINFIKHIPYKNKIIKKLFSSTTIGSFPQNIEIRIIRKLLNIFLINKNEYDNIIKNYIYITTIKQIKLKINVITNGEFERSDMVEYFSNKINGFIVTENGWVQSYGSRYVKPPIIFNIKNSINITENWYFFFDKISKKQKKVILTGPITIYKWSFCLNNKNKFIICLLLSEIINKEVLRLQKKFKIFQIDEPAIKECLSTSILNWNNELNKYITCFNNCLKNKKNNIEIHSHICYSFFNNIIFAINKLNINVLTIESTREDMNNVFIFKNTKFNIGAGLFDVHSPINLTIKEIKKKLYKKIKQININKIWLNPDCGLKTRKWSEIVLNLKQFYNIQKKILNCLI